VRLLTVQVTVASEDLVDRGSSHLCASRTDAVGGRSDDPLLGGQQLGGRVPPVAAGGRHDVTGPGTDALGAGTHIFEAGSRSRSARIRTTPSRSRNLAVSATASTGVTSNALATAPMASRREKLDPSR